MSHILKYRIFLLTMWQEPSSHGAESVPWRFRLEEPHSGRQQLFADAPSLLAAIQAMIANFDADTKSRDDEDLPTR